LRLLTALLMLPLLLAPEASSAEVHTLRIGLAEGPAQVIVPDPDFGQVEFGRDVDGDGRPDHTWCGEVAVLTMYNVAVARGIWEPILGEVLTPEALEVAEVEFWRATGLKTESERDAGVYPYAIFAVAGGNVGVIVWRSKGSPDPKRRLHVPHAVVVLGATEDGTEFVVKDCSFLDPFNPTNPIANYMDYMEISREYLVWKMVPVINAAIQAGASLPTRSPGTILPWATPVRITCDWRAAIAYFPLPRSPNDLPRELAWLREGLHEVRSYRWCVGGRVVEITVYGYSVSSVEELVDVVRKLALAGVPVVCKIDLPLGAHGTDETPPPEFMRGRGWECGYVGMEILERVRGEEGTGEEEPGVVSGVSGSQGGPSGYVGERASEGEGWGEGASNGAAERGATVSQGTAVTRVVWNYYHGPSPGSERSSKGSKGESKGHAVSGVGAPEPSSERKSRRRGVPVLPVAVAAVIALLARRINNPRPVYGYGHVPG